MKKSIGFISFICGCGGIAEAYGNSRAIIISLILMIIGCLILFTEVKDEKVNNHRNIDNVNVLSRLQYLPR